MRHTKIKFIGTALTLMALGGASALGGGPVPATPQRPVSAAASASFAPITVPARVVAPVIAAPATAPVTANVGGVDTQVCQPVTDAQIAALFDRWNASLGTLDAAKVSANYAPQAVLLPTVSNRVRVTPASIQDYFVHFLEKKPQGRIDSRVIRRACNVAIDAGIYTFAFGDGSGAQARFTYVYEYDPERGEWLIASHHSSVLPQAIEREVAEHF